MLVFYMQDELILPFRNDSLIMKALLKTKPLLLLDNISLYYQCYERHSKYYDVLEVFEYQSRVSMFRNQWEALSYRCDQLPTAKGSTLNAFTPLFETLTVEMGIMYDKRFLKPAPWECVVSNETSDEDGWQYASRLERFEAVQRQVKTVAEMGSKFRRRLWKQSLVLTQAGLQV